jgi:hypothetical protein
MTTHNCGRIDDHDAPHPWTRPRMPRWPAETFVCEGPPSVVEGGWHGDADKADDAWEHMQDRARREVDVA